LEHIIENYISRCRITLLGAMMENKNINPENKAEIGEWAKGV